ncbi:MAG: septal ring lytic transglycosylase RlpA family protein [Bacteroidota bacterium]
MLKKIKRFFFMIIIFTIAFGCSTSIRFSSDESYGYEKGAFTGYASFYADKFHGRQTSNGEIFDQNKLTAAHKTLPFNTKVKVVNLRNSRTVTVRINDRGPFVGGRIIDLSKEAARQIGMINDGVVKVRVEVLN